MPARRTRRRNICWLIFASTLLTACQSLDFPHTETPSTAADTEVTQETVQVCAPEEVEPRIETRVVTRTEVIYQPVSIENKLVIGAVEAVSFSGIDDLMLDARIDTGATTSSLHVTSSQIFERDGARWVSFTFPKDGVDGNEEITLERPLARSVLIKRKGVDSQERPVIIMNIRIGKLERTSEFTLTDRTGFEFPVLIGRNFLTDMAIVDVSHEYLVSEKL